MSQSKKETALSKIFADISIGTLSQGWPNANNHIIPFSELQ